MIPSYTLTSALPKPEEYVNIRTVAGLTPPPRQGVEKALANSVHCIVVRASPQIPRGDADNNGSDNNTASHTGNNASSGGAGAGSQTSTDHQDSKLVGMVRLVGDGALMCQIVDMAVHPDHQRRGLGKQLLDAMILWIDEHAPDAYVSLIGDPSGQRLYRSRGFVETMGIGMRRGHWGR